jgi:hypothetical protein
MNFVEKAAPKVRRLNQNSKRQKKNEIAIDHRWLQGPLNNKSMAQMARESFSGRNRTRDPHAKRGTPILPEISLEATSPTSVQETLQTTCPMKERHRVEHALA